MNFDQNCNFQLGLAPPCVCVSDNKFSNNTRESEERGPGRKLREKNVLSKLGERRFRFDHLADYDQCTVCTAFIFTTLMVVVFVKKHTHSSLG